MSDASRLMTQQEVADLLRVSRKTLANWRSRGYGPPGIKVGGAVRWRRAEVDEWVANRADTDPMVGRAG